MIADMREYASVLFVAAIVALAGCRTTKEVLNDYEASLVAGNYSAPTQELLELSGENDGSQQMWRLLAANSLYLADDRVGAIRQFDLAEQVFFKNDQTSVFAKGAQGSLAMLTNDKAFDYDGGGLDRVFTCIYRAIDFMALSQRDNARVELNRAMQYQRNWLYDRKKDIEAAAKKLDSETKAYQRQQNTTVQDHSSTVNAAISNRSFADTIRRATGFDPATSGNLSTMPEAAFCNTYATHLTGVFRWLNGDDGRDDLNLARRINPSSAAVARDYSDCDNSLNPRNQVWIWVEDGLCPTREEWRLDLPIILIPFAGKYLPYVGMALPVLKERSVGAANWTATGAEGAVSIDEIENVDRLVRTEYDVYMRGALVREITRVVVKAGVQVALAIAAENSDDDGHRLALRLSQLGVAAWAAATVGADIRSWTSLPKRVLAVRVERPADGVVKVQADGQNIPINLPEGNSLVFIRRTAPSANPVIKTATWK